MQQAKHGEGVETRQVLSSTRAPTKCRKCLASRKYARLLPCSLIVPSLARGGRARCRRSAQGCARLSRRRRAALRRGRSSLLTSSGEARRSAQLSADAINPSHAEQTLATDKPLSTMGQRSPSSPQMGEMCSIAQQGQRLASDHGLGEGGGPLCRRCTVGNLEVGETGNQTDSTLACVMWYELWWSCRSSGIRRDVRTCQTLF